MSSWRLHEYPSRDQPASQRRRSNDVRRNATARRYGRRRRALQTDRPSARKLVLITASFSPRFVIWGASGRLAGASRSSNGLGDVREQLASASPIVKVSRPRVSGQHIVDERAGMQNALMLAMERVRDPMGAATRRSALSDAVRCRGGGSPQARLERRRAVVFVRKYLPGPCGLRRQGVTRRPFDPCLASHFRDQFSGRSVSPSSQ